MSETSGESLDPRAPAARVAGAGNLCLGARVGRGREQTLVEVIERRLLPCAE
jgi:hypothetical protein